MKNVELRKRWMLEEKEFFKGLDFTHLEGRWEKEKLPWNYRDIVKQHVKADYKLLDMGTGDGEKLLSLEHPFKNTYVTEAYEPNYFLCKEKLEPLGITVKRVLDDQVLSFSDNFFDIIINHHEFYDINEVKRILKPGGMFITQQVGGKNNEILSNALIKNFQPEFPNHMLNEEVDNLRDMGFEIVEQDEYFPYIHFFDVGGVIIYAKIIEWEFPGFTVMKCFQELCKLQEELHAKGYIESHEHRFIIVARNT